MDYTPLNASSLNAIEYYPPKNLIAYWKITASLPSNSYIATLEILPLDSLIPSDLIQIVGKPSGLSFLEDGSLIYSVGPHLYRATLDKTTHHVAELPGTIRSISISWLQRSIVCSVVTQPRDNEVWVFSELPFKQDGEGYLRGTHTIWRVSVDHPSPERIELLNGYETALIAPDGQHLLGLRRSDSVQDLLDRTMVLMDTQTQQLYEVSAPRAPLALAWSPDSIKFALIAKSDTIGTPEPPVLYIGHIDNRELTVLYHPNMGWPGADGVEGADWRTAVTRKVLTWRNDHSVLLTESYHGSLRIIQVCLNGKVDVLTPEGADYVEAVSVRTDDLITISHDLTRYDEITLVKDHKPTILTRHNAERFLPPRELWLNSGDSDRLHVFVLEAVSPARGTILSIHGGPYNAFTRQPTVLYHALAQRGFNVVWTNPHGSIGYGREYALSLQGHWGEKDESDWEQVVRFLEQEGYNSHYGVMGISYGGFMAAWLAGHWAQRLKAAVIQAPVVNQLNMLWASDIGYTFTLKGCQITWDDPDLANQVLWKNSPLRYAHSISCPVLILQGLNDQRCPIAESSSLYTLLKTRNIPTEFVVYPGESHLMTTQGRPRMRQDRFDRILAWFDRWFPRP